MEAVEVPSQCWRCFKVEDFCDSYQEVCEDFRLPACMANFAAWTICPHMFLLSHLQIYVKILFPSCISLHRKPTPQISNYQEKELFFTNRMILARSQKTKFLPVKTFLKYNKQQIFQYIFLWGIWGGMKTSMITSDTC